MTQSHLDGVYAARTASELTERYDRWAETYESDMARAGYRHPVIAVALLSRHLPAASSPVLDAGAGTGLVGEWLGILGYPHVEAVDASAGMLDIARSKGVYRKLHLGLIGALPFPDGTFAGAICSGVFTTGHVEPDALPDLVRVVAPGGVVVVTVKGSLWDEGMADAVRCLVDDGVVRQLEVTERYQSMPGEGQRTPSLAAVLRVEPTGATGIHTLDEGLESEHVVRHD